MPQFRRGDVLSEITYETRSARTFTKCLKIWTRMLRLLYIMRFNINELAISKPDVNAQRYVPE